MPPMVLSLYQQALVRFSLGSKAVSNHGFVVAMNVDEIVQSAGAAACMARCVCKRVVNTYLLHVLQHCPC